MAETIEVPRELVPRRAESFVLRVRGDSMIEDQIRDGDYVIVESRPEARDGETVVALIRGEDATLKRFYRRGAAVRLEPANAALRPDRASRPRTCRSAAWCADCCAATESPAPLDGLGRPGYPSKLRF